MRPGGAEVHPEGVTEPAFPDTTWYRALPAEARAEFEAEFTSATSADRPATLAAWKSTGEVYANPELLAALTADSADSDDPMPPETVAGLAYLRDRPEVFGAAAEEPAEPNPRIQAAVAEMRAERTQARRRDGFTVGVYFPPEASDADIDAIMSGVADAAYDHEHDGQWDPFVVGRAGDWLYIDHHPDEVTDYAAHVRAARGNGEQVQP